ncbi:MAG TPA: hypothetical protein VFX48_08195 [Saprospiraceae bacterium]|nr:hypothetical protein [Saprospiraceae bacterium]
MRHFVITVLFFSIFLSRPYAQVPSQDSLALVALYNATNGPQWKNKTNWLQGPVSKWHGVTVFGNRVYLLNLWDNGLSGTIPNEIGFLTGLVELSLGMSSLQGPIPASIGQLTELSGLNLRRSGIQGQIPAAIGQCTKLAQLYLGENRLEGSIPSSLSNCKQLYVFQLHKNQLSGLFPEVVLDLPKLASLELSDNQFSGPVPARINEFELLRSLSLSKNQFSGPLPRLNKLVNLEGLALEENQFTGDLDTILSYHPNLGYCFLNNNRFTGKLMPAHFNPEKIVRLHASDNQLDQLGDFSSWNNQAQFVSLIVSYNRLDFDDLVPNASIAPNKFACFPQLTIGNDTTISAPIGSKQEIRSPMQNPDVQYSWFHNSLPISGATSSKFTIQSMDQDSLGSYLYQAKHPAFPRFELYSANWNFKLPSAAEQLLDPSDYRFCYDPASSQIHVLWNSAFLKKTIRIYNLGGQLLHSAQMEERFSLSMAPHAAGWYIVDLRTEAGHAAIRFVKY